LVPKPSTKSKPTCFRALLLFIPSLYYHYSIDKFQSYGTSLDPEHPTGAVPPQTTASDQGLSPVDILNTLERHFRLQDMGQIAEILMNHYSGNRDCPILKDLMLVLIKRPVIALDGTKECSAGAITAEIINFIKQRGIFKS